MGMVKKYPKSVQTHPELKLVTTAAGCAERFYLNKSTVIDAINTGRLAAVKCGHVWLVSLNSARELWSAEKPD